MRNERSEPSIYGFLLSVGMPILGLLAGIGIAKLMGA